MTELIKTSSNVAFKISLLDHLIELGYSIHCYWGQKHDYTGEKFVERHGINHDIQVGRNGYVHGLGVGHGIGNPREQIPLSIYTWSNLKERD